MQDLGDIFENSGRVTSKFKLSNPYWEDTIRITDVTTSCGCTAILTQDTIILPRSAVDLEFSYDPAGRLGLFVKSIEITSRTGRDETNKLFLKITGNVIAENYTASKVKTDLTEYSVAPIYFFPITSFDTSYLDFNYITGFINDLTYEVDYYQFATVGVEIEVADRNSIEDMEFLVELIKEKVYREFKLRGYPKNTAFFDEPIFKEASSDFPSWANATVRLYSVNFDGGDIVESAIKVTSTEHIEETKMLLDYQRFSLPELEEVLAEVNFDIIEGKLFLNKSLDLRGMILMPWKKSEKLREKTAKNLEKALLKELKRTTGANKKFVRVSIDSLGIHPDDKYRFILWDKADEQSDESFSLEVKEDDITSPQLPTFKQYYSDSILIDTTTRAFQYFWNNLILNHKSGKDIVLLMESSLSNQSNSEERVEVLAYKRGQRISEFISAKFFNETGDFPEIIIRTFVHGPEREFFDRNPNTDSKQFEYFTLVPIIHTRKDIDEEVAKPYMVNFDFFFKGINTGSYGFQSFANYLAAEVLRNGYVELRIESGISRIPVEDNKSNNDVAYSRLLESERRLKEAMKKRLIDPNRIIYADERVLIQGPEYDGTVPVLRYKKYHYIRIIPEKMLNK